MIRMVYDNALQYGDLDRTGGINLVDDLDLETAVQISILTERRAEPDDEYTNSYGYKGGWWGDDSDSVKDRIGSRLWLLRREKATIANLNRAKTYLEECLQWLLDDGVALSVEVTTYRGTTPVDLGFAINITRPGETNRWSRVWEVQLDEL